MTQYSLAEAQKGNMLRAISGDFGARRRRYGGKVAYQGATGLVSLASVRDNLVGEAPPRGFDYFSRPHAAPGDGGCGKGKASPEDQQV